MGSWLAPGGKKSLDSERFEINAVGNMPELSYYTQTDTITGHSSVTLFMNIPHAQGTTVTLPRIPSGHLKMSFQMTYTHSSSSSLNYANVFTCAKSLQLCPTLWDPMDYNLPGSSVHGNLQARILERVVIPSPRGSSRPRVPTPTHVSLHPLHWLAGSLH